MFAILLWVWSLSYSESQNFPIVHYEKRISFICIDCKRKYWTSATQEAIEKNKEMICMHCHVDRTQRDIFNKFEMQKTDVNGRISIIENEDADGRVSVIEEESKSESNKNEPK